MPIRHRISLPSLALLLLLVPPANAQGPAPVDLGKRIARSKYQLGRIYSVQELPDGRVVASDIKEAAFRLLDLTRGTDELIGKQGDSTDQYRVARDVLPLPGDSLMLYDPAGRKALHLGPDGTVAGMVPLPMPAGVRSILPTASDLSGHLYYSVQEIDTVARIMKPTAILRRYAPANGAVEDVTQFHTRRADQLQAKGLLVFPFRDAWAVRRDGLVARVAADTYQVIWLRDGHETGRTGPLPYTPIAISPAEQQAIADSIHQGMKGMMSGTAIAGQPNRAIGDGGGGTRVQVLTGDGVRASGGAPMIFMGGADGAAVPAGGAPGTPGRGAGAPINFNPADIPIAPFPDTRPAIQSSGLVAAFDPNGTLWVARERPHGDNIPKYDLIVEGRGIVGQVKLPANTRLVGFGKNGVYLAHPDGDAEWLERYALPKR
ncbi:MAG: hypothetical protein ACREK8_01585 [Gemmatimonadales bacterium]